MCLVSVIGDDFQKRHQPLNDYLKAPQNFQQAVSRMEFDALKKEVELLKEVLKKAKAFDEQTGQKDCEMEDKIKFLKKVAESVGVDLTEVFGK